MIASGFATRRREGDAIMIAMITTLVVVAIAVAARLESHTKVERARIPVPVDDRRKKQ
jgi:hypothetical protein